VVLFTSTAKLFVMISTRVVVGLLVLSLFARAALSADSTSTAASASFDFHSYLIGEWDVLKSEASFDPPSFDFSPYRGHYNFVKDNSTSSLLGRYFDNHTETGDIENTLTVLVEFDDNSNGQWKTGRDEDSLTQLFPFSFVTHPAGHPTSVGEWHGADESHYVLQINAPDKFTITVQPRRGVASGGEESEEGVVIYSLRKKAEPAAKTFFQQYGTWLMLGVFFVVNMWVKTRQQVGGPPTAAPTPAALTAAKKSR